MCNKTGKDFVSITAAAAISVLLALGCQTPPPPTATVPDVVGMPWPDAQAAVLEVGLTTGRVDERFDAQVPSGNVLAQNPSAGTQLPTGEAVHMTISQGIQQVRVPNIVGMMRIEAEQAIVQADLTTGNIDAAFSDEAPEGQVLAQNPGAGTQLAAGSGVDFVVSGGRRYVTVPDVTNRSKSAAESLLVEAGLAKGEVARRASHDVQAGTVMTQDPEAGVDFPYGGSVDLVLSAGPPQATVPNLVGQRGFEAEDAIENAGLAVGIVTREASSDVEFGRVIRQAPDAGSQRPRGTKVDYVLSEGALRITVPDVRGMSRDAAAASLRNAGVGLGEVTELSDPNVPAGRIIRQDPPGNMGVEQGTSVRLFISTGP